VKFEVFDIFDRNKIQIIFCSFFLFFLFDQKETTPEAFLWEKSRKFNVSQRLTSLWLASAQNPTLARCFVLPRAHQ